MLYDISDEQLAGALVAVGDQLGRLEREGLLREGQTREGVLARVTVSSNLVEAVQGACYIQV